VRGSCSRGHPPACVWGGHDGMGKVVCVQLICRRVLFIRLRKGQRGGHGF
jgi:hypothetical protein